MLELVVSTLEHWTPSKLLGQPAHIVKSVEKSLRILLMHLSRLRMSEVFTERIRRALDVQAARMEQAAIEEKQRRAAEASRKRSASSGPTAENPDVKRVKLDDGTPSPLAGFDFTTLPANLVTDLIVANLQVFPEPTLASLIQNYLTRNGVPPVPVVVPEAAPGLDIPAIPAIPVAIAPAIPVSVPVVTSTPAPVSSIPTGPSTSKPSAPTPAPPTAPRADRERAAAVVTVVDKPQSTPPAPAEPEIKDEPVDPLKMDIDDDEVDYTPEKLTDEVSARLTNHNTADAVIDIVHL